MEIAVFLFKFLPNGQINNKQTFICLDDCLVFNRLQAIIWTMIF